MNGFDKDIIKFENNISPLWFYEEFLDRISHFYKQNYNGNNDITLSMLDVEWIDPMVIPNILSLGLILTKYHKKPIDLLLPFNMRLLYFFNSINFFQAAKYQEKDIFRHDEDLIERALFFNKKKYRDKHKVYTYPPFSNYYNEKDQNKKEQLKIELYEALVRAYIPIHYKEILEDQKVLSENEISILISIFAEIICNSMIYSRTTAFSFLQTNEYKTSISVSDSGIGFKKSLIGKCDFPLLDKYSDLNDYTLGDFYIIMDTLNYSMERGRTNLWALKSIIVNSGGTLRIHYNSTQIIFTASRCQNCEKYAEDCLKCILDNYHTEKRISPLRLFNINLKGVHIEIELMNKRGNS